MSRKFVWTPEESKAFAKHLETVGNENRAALKNLIPKQEAGVGFSLPEAKKRIQDLGEAVARLEARLAHLERRKSR